jgi:hypothetical protein
MLIGRFFVLLTSLPDAVSGSFIFILIYFKILYISKAFQ